MCQRESEATRPQQDGGGSQEIMMVETLHHDHFLLLCATASLRLSQDQLQVSSILTVNSASCQVGGDQVWALTRLLQKFYRVSNLHMDQIPPIGDDLSELQG